MGRTLDGGAYPTVLEGFDGSAGKLHLGPAGFLARLEQLLGIPTPLDHEPVRVAEYAKRIAAHDDSNRFYSASRRADPWRVARKLLSLRDELVSAGWNGKLPANASVRLKGFSELEEMSNRFPVAPGHPDRLLKVCERLTLLSAGIECLELIDPPSSFPKLWRDVFQTLRQNGTQVWHKTETPARASGDLGLAQKALVGKSNSKVTGDGSLLRIEAKTLMEAAEATSACLSSLLRNRGPDSVVLIRDGEPRASLVLEPAIRRHDLASPGLTLESSHRPATQILPLFLGLAWEPVDPDLLLQFLTLPSSPLPARAREDLRRALSAAPGYGSQSWKQARKGVIDAIREKYGTQQAGDADRRIKDWLDDVARTPAGQGMPIEQAVRLTRQVEDWANRRAHSDETDPFFLQAKEQAFTMCRLLELHPEKTITRLELGRLLFDILQTGISYEIRSKEQESIHLVASPASVFGRVPIVIWWQCVGSSAFVPTKCFWSDEEVRALENAGCHLLSSTDILLENARASRRPVLCATQLLILVQPEQAFGEPQESHPIWNEIAMKIAPTEAEQLKITALTDSLIAGGQFALKPIQTQRKSLPEPKPLWNVPPIHLTPRHVESATSLEILLGCPLRWTLQYKARIRDPLEVIVERELLYGSLAHQIVGDYLSNFIGKTLPEPDTARIAIAGKFDRCVALEAATLIKPGRDRERIYVRQTMSRATGVLVELLQRGGYRIDSIEEEHSGSFDLGELQGRTDLIVRRAKDGMRAIIDLKWSRDKRRVEALKNGTALQLAVYSYFVRGKNVWPSTAYFIFPTAQLYSTDRTAFPGCTFIPGPTEEQMWGNVVLSIRKIRASLDAGKVDVPCFSDTDGKAPAKEPEGMSIEAPCTWCDFKMFCRYE
ncbi:MAG: PD-(D/E)XK nuclease family protein [Deltaproteobacteria bacterium]|nr:PD-(D/E)XK nuclease family protein [Deltaproteobacteria bacterium]